MKFDTEKTEEVIFSVKGLNLSIHLYLLEIM